MGHYLSGDLPYGQLRRFERFPLLAWLVECGEMLVVPRFEWESRTGRTTASQGQRRRPSNGRQGDAGGAEASSGSRCRSRTCCGGESWSARARLNQTLGDANGPSIGESLPAPYETRALWAWHEQQYPAQMRALEARDREGTYFTLLFAITPLLASSADHVFVCDDGDAQALKDFVKRRFFRLSGSRVAARARLEELVASTHAALAQGDGPRAQKECGYALTYTSELAESNELAASAYIASARIKALAGDGEQARCDLAWADHLAGGRYAGPHPELAQLVREQT